MSLHLPTPSSVGCSHLECLQLVPREAFKTSRRPTLVDHLVVRRVSALRATHDAAFPPVRMTILILVSGIFCPEAHDAGSIPKNHAMLLYSFRDHPSKWIH